MLDVFIIYLYIGDITKDIGIKTITLITTNVIYINMEIDKRKTPTLFGLQFIYNAVNKI